MAQQRPLPPPQPRGPRETRRPSLPWYAQAHPPVVVPLMPRPARAAGGGGMASTDARFLTPVSRDDSEGNSVGAERPHVVRTWFGACAGRSARQPNSPGSQAWFNKRRLCLDEHPLDQPPRMTDRDKAHKLTERLRRLLRRAESHARLRRAPGSHLPTVALSATGRYQAVPR